MPIKKLPHISKRLAIVVIALSALAMSGHAQAVSMPLDNQYGVTFRNNDGDWTFWKNCFEYWDGSRTVTIGPGYIGRLVRNGVWITNDEREKHYIAGNPPTLNDPRYGGLGQFGWHHARGTPGSLNTSDVNRVWDITGRRCAGTSGGFGVVSASIIQGPLVFNNIGYFDMDVYFADHQHSAGNPILRVRYRWRIFDSVIKMWAQVSEYCPDGCFDSGEGYAFVKEPKFVANVARTPGQPFPAYTRLAVFARDGNLCAIFLGSDPTSATGHAACQDRVRFRFDFGTAGSGGNGGCSTTNPCLNAVATAYDIDDGAFSQSRQHYLWEGYGWGLDEWAARSGGRPAGNSTGCNTSAGFATSPAQDAVRRWELIGGPKIGGAYERAAAMFPGWEGCNSAYSAGALYRLWGYNNEFFGVHMQFSVNDGWSLPSMP